MTLDIEIVAEGLAFPEGPVALSDGSVLFVEIVGGVLKRAWDHGRTEVVARLGGGPNGAQLGPDGAVYVCNNGGIDLARMRHATGPGCEGRIERVDLATGKVERLYDRCGDHPLSAPNDLVFDADGGFWFTDMGKHLGREAALSGVYYARPDGSRIEEVHYGGVSYNGIGLSPDARALYVSDTQTARVWQFALDGPGRLAPTPAEGGRRRLLAAAPGDATLDSLAVTESGGVCVATIGRGGISAIDAQGAVQHVPLPDGMVTNIAFGGPDMRTAFVTLASTGRLARMRWPEPGLRLNFAA